MTATIANISISSPQSLSSSSSFYSSSTSYSPSLRSNSPLTATDGGVYFVAYAFNFILVELNCTNISTAVRGGAFFLPDVVISVVVAGGRFRECSALESGGMCRGVRMEGKGEVEKN
jgi:hypothetical protein